MIKKPKKEDLRALFPGLYSRRDKDSGAYWDRNWLTQQFPNIRLMGPLWSFAVTLKARSDTYEADVYLEHPADELFPGHNLHYAPPTVMRADIEKLWEDGLESRSRLSMVAVNTVVKGELVLPFGDSELLNKTSPLIVAPFGRQAGAKQADQQFENGILLPSKLGQRPCVDPQIVDHREHVDETTTKSFV